MLFFHIYLIGAAVILTFMFLLWLASLALKNAAIVDIFWGFGFVLTGWLFFALTPQGLILRKILLMTIVSIWGLRLTLHIYIRNHGKAEDFRYAAWRAEAGKAWWWRSFFKVFFLQGLLMWVISIPLLAAQITDAPFSWLDLFGLLVWTVGFYFKAAGDAQLSAFKADVNNKGKVLNSGVWHYTRHPNYFGDATQWWGFYLLALAAGGWWVAYSSILMTLLLLRVSGVALLEKTLKDTKPGYREYIERTSAFFPLPPKSRKD